MVWTIIFVCLPFILIIGAILFFNIYMRKQITKDITQGSALDQAYIEAEKARTDDDFIWGEIR
jgi:hypothetical protein